MPSTGERKRSHDGTVVVSVSAITDEPSPSSRFIGKQLKSSHQSPPGDESRQEQKRPCVLDLPALVVAQVGKYLNVEQRDGQKALTSLGVVLGSQTASVIRQEYLGNNLDYLTYLRGRIRKLTETVGKKEIAHVDLRKALLVLKAALEEWIQCNTWWKEACLRAYGLKGSGNSHSDIAFRTIRIKGLQDFSADQYRRCQYPSGHLVIRHKGQYGDFTFVTNVNGIQGKTLSETNQMLILCKDRVKPLCLLHESFAKVFFNPTMIVDLGVLDVLKFQIHELNIDVKRNRFVGILGKQIEVKATSSDGESRRSFQADNLLYHAIFQPDDRLLALLMSDTTFISSPTFNKYLLHDIPMLFANQWKGYRDLDKVDLLLRTQVLDPEQLDENDRTALDVVCFTFRRAGTAETIDFMHRLAKLYLSHGAKVTEKALQEMKCHRRMMDLLEAYKLL